MPRWGVTDPFSTETPSQQDLRLNDALMAELKAQNNFPPQSDTDKRESLLKKLEGLLRQMVQIVGKKKGLPNGILETAGGKVFTYGSYRLGVYGPNSDVDTLMIAPKYVTREEFFEYMPDLLKKFCGSDISEMVSVPGIAIPIIKLCLQGVDIDLIFSSIQQLQTIPNDLDLADDTLLRGMNDTDMKCVNGARVTNRILQLVPQTKTFRQALRAIKLWAQRRAIYGNIVGYPGGVAWAILVARVCQLYPHAVAPLLLHKFFFIMRKWNWPKPVFLQLKQENTMNAREWDPQVHRRDAAHLMPALTPMFPLQNSAHTVGPSTKMVLMRELQRGEEIVMDIYANKRQWKDLFEKHTFFTSAYKHYICVITAGKTKSAHDSWTGLVESKVKWLVDGIERSDANTVELVQPFTKGFHRVHEVKDHDELEKTLDGSIACKVKKTETVGQATDQAAAAMRQVAAQTDGADAATANDELKAEKSKLKVDDAEEMKVDDVWPKTIYTTTYYLGIGLKKGPTNLDISLPVMNFHGDCTRWNDFDKELHSIRIKHIRNFDLPDDLFTENEVRPMRPKKKTKTVVPMPTADPANNKRSFTNAGLDESAASAKRRQSANGPSAALNGIGTPFGNNTAS